MANLEGRTLDRYELRQLLGKGGMADVYLGYDTRFDREVAVKVFKREDEDLLRRFIREAQLMVKLSNPHLMRVYAAGNAQIDGMNVYYIAMPFMSGGTLRSRVRGTPLAPKEACRYLRDIANALDYMHEQGIIHRDIKASNVLLDAEGRCYLSDFGIARSTTDATQMTSTGNVLGTVEYMAPELFEDDGKADAYTDLYALGILLFEMVTGRLPFTSENQIAVVTMHVNKRPPAPRSFVSDLSPAIERVILKSIEKRPENRYGSAAELADAFCRAIDVPVIPAFQVGDDQPTRISTLNTQVRQEARGVPVDYEPQLGMSRPYSPVPVPAPYNMSSQQMSQPFPSRSTAYAPPRRSSQQVRQARILAILVAFALLVVLGSIIFAIAYRSQAPSVNTFDTATATNSTQVAQANATAAQQQTATATANAANSTAQAHATATQTAKNANATATAKAATAVAAPSATAGVLQTATATQPIYNSALTSPDSAQWDESRTCAFQSDGYHVRVDLITAIGGFSTCRETGNQYQNFAAKVDLRESNGTSGGLFFHIKTGALSTFTEGYLFELNATNGQYRISRSDNFTANPNPPPLQDWTSSSTIKKGNGINTLGLWVKDGSMSFYINGQYLVTLHDTTYNSGNLALLARGGNGADMAYSKLSVYNVQ